MAAERERRRYFRVTDQVLMSYQVVSDGGLSDGHGSGASEPSAPMSHRSQALNRIEEKLSQKMVKLHSDNPELADIMSLLNQKLNLLVGHVEEGQKAPLEKQSLNVNVSACGIAFPAEDALSIGSLLVLQLTLTLSYVTLSLSAQVVGVDPLEEEAPLDGEWKYLIRADFIEISDVDQELLVQHVLKRQSEQLKALREARERGEAP